MAAHSVLEAWTVVIVGHAGPLFVDHPGLSRGFPEERKCAPVPCIDIWLVGADCGRAVIYKQFP